MAVGARWYPPKMESRGIKQYTKKNWRFCPERPHSFTKLPDYGQHVIEYVQKDLMELFENLHSGTPSNAKHLHHFVKSHDVIVGGAKNHSRDR